MFGVLLGIKYVLNDKISDYKISVLFNSWDLTWKS